MALEVERKFRLPQTPAWPSEHPTRRIVQGYLATNGDVEVRIRSVDEERYLTVKRGHGEVREEVEVGLSDEQFEMLWPLTEPLRIEKRRHLVPVDGLTAEVDVFEGRLAGLVLAEIEFPSQAESRRFQPPAWLGEEVTGDDRYSNRRLAEAGLGGGDQPTVTT
jgi:adenylate cyclase